MIHVFLVGLLSCNAFAGGLGRHLQMSRWWAGFVLALATARSRACVQAKQAVSKEAAVEKKVEKGRSGQVNATS